MSTFQTAWFLLKSAFRYGRMAGELELAGVIHTMRPVSAGRELIRLGGEHDGGYLVPDDLGDVAANFSPGVSDSVAFEEDLAQRYGIPSFLADYSVERPPAPHGRFDFEKKFLGTVNTDRHMRLEDWVTRNAGPPHGKDLLLQMDIEGDEFAVLLDTPAAVLRRFRIMVVEFHRMERMFAKDTLGMIGGIFDKVLRDFCVVHIHPNNFDRLYRVGRVAIPRTLEVTFYRRDRAVFDHAALRFPHRLDRKNAPQMPDVILPDIWRHDPDRAPVGGGTP